MTTGWGEGELAGLPPAALDRVRHQQASGVRGSLLSAPAAAAVRSAGLEPVGEVFGCVVVGLGWTGGPCGYGYGWNTGYGSGGWAGGPLTPVVVSGNMAAGRFSWARPYAEAVTHSINEAHRRMLTEARALGADGVLGITRTLTSVGGSAREYATLGTAVRHVDPAQRRDPARPPWAATLTGEDCAAAAIAGFRPAGVAFGYSLALKHEDWQLRQQRSTWVNQEVDGLTELLTAARADARRSLARESRRAAGGGSGGEVVITSSSLYTYERVCAGEQKDLLAEALFVGTVLEQHARRGGSRRRALTVLPLTPPTAAARRRNDHGRVR
jgi:uncharacterized protein YbjQ (UPF0145 family)